MNEDNINRAQKHMVLLSQVETLQNKSRSELQCMLRQKGTSQLFLSYYSYLEIFLSQILNETKALNNLSEHPYEWVVISHTMRFKRYAMGLACMFPQGQGVMRTCYDGTYPILKSFFELIIESRMARAFLHEFKDTDDPRKTLAERIRIYADFNKKDANFKHNFGFSLKEIPDFMKPDLIKQYESAGIDKHKIELRELSKRLGCERVKDLRHWYPYNDSKGTPTTRGDRHDTGKVRWCVEDILASHLPDSSEMDQWKIAYKSTYDTLNTYSHPIQGYDDCFRAELERSYDFFKISVEVLILFHKFTLPELLLTLRASNDDIETAKNKIDEAFKYLINCYSIFAPLVEKSDREGRKT